MRNIFFTFILLISTGRMVVKAQSNIMEYLESDDLKGFIKSCDQNGQMAIDSLINLSLNDTITSNQIWYNQTEAKGINPLERSTEGADKFYTSVKLKSYYWILQIFYSKYNCIDKNLCVFVDNDNDFIFDYEIANKEAQKQALKEILIGESKSQKIVFKYKIKPSIALEKLDQYFQNWYAVMKEKGLEYMQKQNIPPINNNRYKISKY